MGGHFVPPPGSDEAKKPGLDRVKPRHFEMVIVYNCFCKAIFSKRLQKLPASVFSLRIDVQKEFHWLIVDTTKDLSPSVSGMNFGRMKFRLRQRV